MTFKDRCTISENCLPDSRYKVMLISLHSEMLARITELENTVRVLGQANAWVNFGECRSFGSDIKIHSPNELDSIAKQALKSAKG